MSILHSREKMFWQRWWRNAVCIIKMCRAAAEPRDAQMRGVCCLFTIRWCHPSLNVEDERVLSNFIFYGEFFISPRPRCFNYIYKWNGLRKFAYLHQRKLLKAASHESLSAALSQGSRAVRIKLQLLFSKSLLSPLYKPPPGRIIYTHSTYNLVFA